MLKMNKLEGKRVNEKNSILKKVFAMFSIIAISTTSFYNIINATITTNIPVSVVKDWNDLSYDFPDYYETTYKPYIAKLKEAHPNWNFKILNTHLDWNESVRQETNEVKKSVSTVPNSYSNNWKLNGDDNVDGSFDTASKKAVAYCMDPRNFLNDRRIFQFESLSYNAGTATTSAIGTILSSTAIRNYPAQYKRSGSMVDLENGLNWIQLIINSAKNCGEGGISAIFLASRMKQETSLDILNNGSINGSNSSNLGIYNFFNYGASPNPDGSGAVENGLAYAATQGWTTPAASISAGATKIWDKYIRWGQNTVYFQKFDVANPYGNAIELYGSQYMTNIVAPSSESSISYNAYLNAGLIDTAFEFIIPIYDHMPSIVSQDPDSQATATNDIVYLDDGVSNGPDTFNVRSGPSTNDSIISKIVENQEGVANRTKFNRIETGNNGYDKIILSDGREGYVYSTYVNVYNTISVTGVSLDKTGYSFKAGETFNLTQTVSPSDAYQKGVSWYSSNTNVATVDSNGKVTAIGVGTATITVATNDGNKTATCNVTVNPTNAESISVDSSYSVGVGYTVTPNVTVSPSTTTNKAYNISITDTSIAKVENGAIKGIKAGTTTVTLTTVDGTNKSCTFTLRVVENVATIGGGLSVSSSGIITKVALSTNAASIKSNITTSFTKKLINASGTVLSDTDPVGTGTKVQILDGSGLLQAYTIAIYGDVNGDAKISSGDYVNIKNYIMTSSSLSDVQKISADYNNDGKVSSGDYVLIKKYIMSR